MASTRRLHVSCMCLWLSLAFATGAAAARKPPKPPSPPKPHPSPSMVFGSFYVIVMGNAGQLSACPNLVDPAVTLAASLNAPIVPGNCLDIPGGMIFSATFTDGVAGMKAVATVGPSCVADWAKRNGVCGRSVQIFIVGSASNNYMSVGNNMTRFNVDGSGGAVGLGPALLC